MYAEAEALKCKQFAVINSWKGFSRYVKNRITFNKQVLPSYKHRTVSFYLFIYFILFTYFFFT